MRKAPMMKTLVDYMESEDYINNYNKGETKQMSEEIKEVVSETQDGQKKRPFVPRKTKVLLKLLSGTEESVPERQTKGSIGYDLKAVEDGEIAPGEIKAVPTGIAVRIPYGTVGLVCPRSGLSKRGLFVINTPGIIDNDYRGEVHCIFKNFGDETISWKKNDRLAQFVFVASKLVKFEIVKDFPEEPNNERGDGKFGSTGMS